MRAVVSDVDGPKNWFREQRSSDSLQRVVLRAINNQLLIETHAPNAETLRTQILSLGDRARVYAADLLSLKPLLSFCEEDAECASDFSLGGVDLLDIINSTELEKLNENLALPIAKHSNREAEFRRQFGTLLPHVRTWHILDPFAWTNLPKTNSGISRLLQWLCAERIAEIVVYTETLGPHKDTKGPPISEISVAMARMRLDALKGASSSEVSMKILESKPPGALHDRFFRLDFDLGSQCVIAGSGAENYSDSKVRQTLTSHPADGQGFDEAFRLFSALKESNTISTKK